MSDQITVTLVPSGGLRAIVDGLPERLEVELEGPTPVREVLIRAGINPLLVMKLATESGPLDREATIGRDMEIHIIGPMAGG